MTKPADFPNNQRAESRFKLNIEVRVVGTDEHGWLLNEEATICNVSARGISFIIPSRAATGSQISVFTLSRQCAGEVAVFEVIWSKSTEGRYLHGARLVEKEQWSALLQRLKALDGENAANICWAAIGWLDRGAACLKLWLWRIFG